MTCPKCGTNLPTDARFCSVCGSNISATAPTANVGFTPPSVSASVGGSANVGGLRVDSDGRGSGRGYSYEVLYQGAFALATVKLQPEQSVNAEAGAMVAMSGNVELQSQMKGGLMGALKRAVGGESAFVSTFTARGGPGEVSFAPGSPGDIAAIELNGQVFYVQSSSYLAGDTGLTVYTRWGDWIAYVSAACGGTTTVIPFACQFKGQSLQAAVDDYHRRAEGKSVIDYAFHLIVTDPTERVLQEELPRLIANGYTSSRKLAIRGGSNGGLLTGAVLTQRPELARAAIVAVPLLDMLRYQDFLMARYWVPE